MCLALDHPHNLHPCPPLPLPPFHRVPQVHVHIAARPIMVATRHVQSTLPSQEYDAAGMQELKDWLRASRCGTGRVVGDVEVRTPFPLSLSKSHVFL